MADANVSIKFKDLITKEYKASLKQIGLSNKQAKQSIGKLDKEFKRLEKQAKRTSKEVKGVSLSMGSFLKVAGGFVALSSLNNLVSESIQLFKEQEDVIARVESIIKSTGGAAGLSSQQVQDMASSLQDVTTFASETILEGQALLLTFKNIGSDVFPRATESMLDLATVLKTDLKGASIQLGKALNDPIVGVGALGEAGITFSQSQKDMIRTLQESGKIAQAQTVILKELESQFGGLSRAVAETDAGRLAQFQNTIDAIKADLGKQLLPALVEVSKEVKKFFDEAKESGELEQIFKNIKDAAMGLADGFIFLVKHADDFVIAGKALFAMFAVSKVQGIVTGIKSLTLSFAALKATLPLAVLGAGLVVIEKIKSAAEGRVDLANAFANSKDIDELNKAVDLFEQYEDAMKRSAKEATQFAFASGLAPSVREMESLNKEILELTGRTFEGNKQIGVTMESLQGRIKLETKLSQLLAKREEEKQVEQATTTEQANPAKGVEEQAKSTQELARIEAERQAQLQEFRNAEQEYRDLEQERIKQGEAILAEFREEGRQTEIEQFRAHINEKNELLQELGFNELDVNALVAKKKEEIRKRDLKSAIATGQMFLSDTVGNLQTIFGKNKALATAQALIDTYAGAQRAYAQYAAFPPLAIAAAGIATTAGLARVAQINSQKFRDGGFITQGQSTGDVTNILANRGEAVLNPGQQRNFMRLANGGGSGPRQVTFGNINITVSGESDANEIANAVRRTQEEQLQELANQNRMLDDLEVTA